MSISDDVLHGGQRAVQGATGEMVCRSGGGAGWSCDERDEAIGQNGPSADP